MGDSKGLRLEGLTKRYRRGKLANDGIDLEVGPGEVLGLLGPNGAGKTTLVRQIMGLLAPSSGRILLDGCDLVKEPDLARQMCSYLPQGALPIDAFRLTEIVELVGRIRGGGRAEVRRRTEKLVASLELEEWRNTSGHRLSGGIKRLCGFLMAAVWPGRLLILDEPTNDVDPLRRRLLWKQIRELGDQGTAVLLVTHNVLEADQSVDRLAVIDEGRIRAVGTSAALKREHRNQLRLEIHLVPKSARPEAPPFALGETEVGHRLHYYVDHAQANRAIEWAQALVAAGGAEEYALGPATLEDVYVRIVGRQDALDRQVEER